MTMTREREDRAEATSERRRRRIPGSLNRMVDMRLDFLDPEFLDPSYGYRWINDTGGRLRRLTKLDDWDFVTAEELGLGFSESQFDQESDGRLRVSVDVDRAGKPVFAYLCKKPQAFISADYEEQVQAREAMMAGRVYRAERGLTADDVEEDPNTGHEYALESNTIGFAGQRRRGPIPKRSK